MADTAADQTLGEARALGALGTALGVTLVALIVALATRDSLELLVVVVAATATACVTLLRLPPWRPAAIGVLIGMAGAYLAAFALLALWLTGVGPS